MRRAIVLALFTSAAVLTACPSPPKPGECKTSKDCESQAGFGKVCVQGRCAECAADADCKDGFECQANACVPKAAPPPPRPECAGDTDCPNGICEGGSCRPPLCGADADCGAGFACEAGRCAQRRIDPACADPAAFTVNFAFDQSSLDGQATATLQKLADCLRQAPATRIEVAGHCDDRGTTQYNLALGKRRAEAVKAYLSDLGVSTAVDTVSYGKERPLCREASEDCWARNRRAETGLTR
jgi:peptidoglycan-associated lipoprotein